MATGGTCRCQIEVSKDHGFDAPTCPQLLRGPGGRQPHHETPKTLELVFNRRIRCGRQRRTQDVFNTKVVDRDTDVTVNTFIEVLECFAEAHEAGVVEFVFDELGGL